VSPRIWPAVALLSAAAAAAALLWVVDPHQAGNPLPPCPSRWLTGLLCPGCGSTRALHALLHGDLSGALAMNPLLVLSLPAVAVLALEWLRMLPTNFASLATRLGNARAWAVVLIAYGVLRNLPWPPFSWLAPGGFGA
jgi:hypothetical protein